MALITMGGTGVVQLADPRAPIRIGPFICGATAIPLGAPCYVTATANTVLPSITTTTSPGLATNTAFNGFAILATAIGDPVTLFGVGTRITIVASGLTIGAYYWCSATAGRISDALVLTGDIPFAYSVSATDIVICRAW